jgi:glycosyltransferase involved in cell wall biosynthesis
MRILFLAPQPFFQERGTPIAVRLALEVLSQRTPRPKIDLLVYHEGETIELPDVVIHRIRIPKFLKGYLSEIRPGITVKKLVCDLFFFLEASRLVLNCSKTERYTLIHAVEESVFIALIFKSLKKIPYLYDMDSSLSLQLTESWRSLRMLRPLLAFIEKLAVRNSSAVVPVCDTLAAVADSAGSPHTCILRDISLLDHPGQEDSSELNLRAAAQIPVNSKVILYVGNLERYQGIDLGIRAFGKIAADFPDSHLVVIGGATEHVISYQKLVMDLELSDRIHLLGPRPVSYLHRLIAEADVLISPRILGNNTPMKIYSYMHSGKPLIATSIASHTQVLHSGIARLCEPNPESFADAITWVLSNVEEAAMMADRARQIAEFKYTFSNFQSSLLKLYDRFKS